KRADDGSWAPGKYEGPGTPYDDGKWYPGKYPSAKEKREDDGSWYPGKYEGAGTPYDDGKWHEGKYEGPGTPYDDGKWYPGKYPSAKEKREDDGSWYPGKYEGAGTPYGDGKWHEGKYEGKGTPYDDGKWHPEHHDEPTTVKLRGQSSALFRKHLRPPTPNLGQELIQPRTFDLGHSSCHSSETLSVPKCRVSRKLETEAVPEASASAGSMLGCLGTIYQSLCKMSACR
ncbi:hypothetical protein BN1723_018964, partial [Verticillium longisporum]